MIVRMMLGLLPFLINAVDPSPDDVDDNDHDDHSDDDNKPTFTKAQQTAINSIVAREARKAAEKARAERDAELDAEREAAEAEAARKIAEEAGEFETVKAQLLADKEKIESDLNLTTKERDDLLAMVKVDVDSAWSNLPAEVRDAYDGDDDDVLARKQHMTKMKKIIDRLAGKPNNGNPPAPKPTDGSFDLDAEINKAKAKVAAKF